MFINFRFPIFFSSPLTGEVARRRRTGEGESFRFPIWEIRAAKPLRGKPQRGRNISAQGDANEVSGALGQRAKDEVPALLWAGQ